MMKIRILTPEERNTCYGHYRNNDLFRHFLPILNEIGRHVTGVDAISLWFNAEQVLQRLRSAIGFRDTEMDFLHAEMAGENDGKTLTTLMFVVFIRLANAAENGHATTANDSICMAILRLYGNDALFLKLKEAFFRYMIGNDGKKVVIAPSDPMTQISSLDDMDHVAKEEMKAYVQKVIDLTQPLRVYLKERWEGWHALWTNICMDAELLHLLKETNPNRNDWGLNQKMICNVVGICVNHKIAEASINALNKALTPKQVSSYISQPKDFGGNNSALTKEQYEKVEAMIKNLL
jgi:hypothetical protein